MPRSPRFLNKPLKKPTTNIPGRLTHIKLPAILPTMQNKTESKEALINSLTRCPTLPLSSIKETHSAAIAIHSAPLPLSKAAPHIKGMVTDTATRIPHPQAGSRYSDCNLLLTDWYDVAKLIFQAAR